MTQVKMRTIILRRPLWPVALPLALILASEYKLRSRPPTETLGGRPDLTVLAEIVVYGIVTLYLYRRFRLRPPVRRTSPLLLLAWAYAVYMAVSVLWSPFPEIAGIRAAQLLVTAAVCQVIATHATLDDLHRLAHAFVVVVLLSIGVGLAFPFPRTQYAQDRFNWLYIHPVTAGIFLGIAVVIVSGFLLRSANDRKWPFGVYVAALTVLAGALIATGTRGAALGCAIAVAVLVASARGARGRVDLLVAALPVVAILVLVFSERILGFVTRGQSSAQLATLNSRTDLWTLALDAFAQQPLFGFGMSATRGLFLEQFGLGGGHNAFVNVLVEGGAIGLIVFISLALVLVSYPLAMLRRHELRPDAAILLAVATFLFVDGLTAEMIASAANVASVWLFVTVAWVHVTLRSWTAPTPTADGRENRPASLG